MVPPPLENARLVNAIAPGEATISGLAFNLPPLIASDSDQNL
jgi:hypothetical protein